MKKLLKDTPKLKKLSLLLLSVFVCSLFFIIGCTKIKPVTESKKIATIDNYHISVSDYNMEKLKFYPYFENTKESKMEILNILIDNTLLLKEAEKEKINADPNFLRTIEHFWRQSLIQQLLNKKIASIRSKTKISEKEIKQTYEKLKNNYHLRVISFHKETKTDLPPDLNQLDKLLKEKNIDLNTDTGWYLTDLYNLPTEIISYFQLNKIKPGKWIIINKGVLYFAFFVKEIKINDIKPISDIKEEIISFLKANKEQTILNEWIKSLRSSSKVTINKELLSEI